MPTVTDKRRERNAIKTKVIQSQHCIQVNDDQIEIIYQFATCTMEIHLNNELILRTTFHPSRLAINYLNLIEVACNYWLLYQERLRKKEKEDYKELSARVEIQPKTNFKEYILKKLTTIIDEKAEK